MIDPRHVPLGRVSVFGVPFHGLVEGGKLTLPNSQEIDYPQPGAGITSTAPYLRGTAFKVRGPGAYVPSRTPEQEADDVAHGREWWDAATVCGPGGALYGHDLRNWINQTAWIYVAPDGSRWITRIRTLHFGVVLDENSNQTYTAEFLRFGEIEGSGDEDSASTTFSDWQQSSPALSGVSSWRTGIIDISSDGSQLIVALTQRLWISGTAEYEEDNQGWIRPLGFLLFEVGGVPGVNPSLTITCLRSRAETVGSVDPPHQAPLGAWQVRYLTWQYDEPQGESPNVVRVSHLQDSGWVADPDATNHSFFQHQGLPTEPEDNRPDTDYPRPFLFRALVGQHNVVRRANKLLSMYFDEQDAIQEVVYHAESDLTVTGVPSMDVVGDTYHTEGTTLVEGVTVTCSYDWEAHEVFRARLEMGDQEYELAYAECKTHRREGNRVVEPDPVTWRVTTNQVSIHDSESQIADLVATSSSDSAITTVSNPTGTNHTTWFQSQQFLQLMHTSGGDPDYGWDWDRIHLSAQYGTAPSWGAWCFVARWAANFFGAMARVVSQGVTTYRYMDVAAPGASDEGVVVSGTPLQYGSFCPVTQRMSWAQGDPVCWV